MAGRSRPIWRGCRRSHDALRLTRALFPLRDPDPIPAGLRWSVDEVAHSLGVDIIEFLNPRFPPELAAAQDRLQTVVRRGSMSLQNALRPLSNTAPAVVLQVTISGKVATAHGRDFEEMRRGGPPQQLEEESGSRIMWDKHLGALPRTILIVGDERSEPIARLRFVACTNVPKVAPARDRAVRTRGPNAGAKPPELAPTRALPQ